MVCGCLPLLGAVLVAVPRQSWLVSAGQGGGRFLWVPWGVPRGLCVCGAARARVVSVLVCVLCVRAGGVGVGVSSVCVGVCVCVCVRVWLGPAGACRWCGCGCGWCVSWLVPRHSWRRFLSAIPRHSWLGFVAGGGGCSSPLLAEGPWCGSPPLLAGVRLRRWCVVACHSWLRVPVAVPRHSWLGGPLVAEGLRGGSPPLLAGVRQTRRWVFPWVGVSRVVCACGAACERGVCAGVCGVCFRCLCWWWCGCGCAFRVRLCVCVCACVVCWWRAVAGPCFLRLLLCW